MRKVSAGNMNGTFLKDGEEDHKVTNQEKGANEMAKGALASVVNLGKSVEEQEEMNTTYSLADVSLSGCKRKREEENEKEKDARKRRSPRMRKPLLS